MLYKKNSAKSLDDALFKSPTSEYRGAPFWSWNCKMNPEMLCEQIEQLKQMGFGGFQMHSRDGMDNPYLSDEFMGLVSACAEKAEKEQMLAFCYDEDRWPSGSAGGLVTKNNPAFRGRFLQFMPESIVNKEVESVDMRNRWDFNSKRPIPYFLDVTAETDKATAIREGKPYFVAAYDITVDENGLLKSYERIPRSKKAEGVKWLAFSIARIPSEWFNRYCYVDTLSKKAVAEFIRITYERYYEVIGDKFDKCVPAIFTDEPQFSRSETLASSVVKNIDTRIAWSYDFDKTFKRKYGYDLLDYLPEAIFDLPSDKPATVRYHLNDHTCDRFTEAFSQQIGAWCRKHNIDFTGHMLLEDHLGDQTNSIGEAMRAYPHFGIPGIDILCNELQYVTAKQCQSVAHQTGKNAVLSELYGVTNWDFDFRGHKFQGDWQAALGITVRVPHLSWVTMAGPSKRDYPAAISYQSAWYKEYPYVEDHFSRLNTALTRGKADVRIGVIHPIETYWLHHGPNNTSGEVKKMMEDRFYELADWLLFSQLDFDYISEALLPSMCKNPSAPLKVGKMSYDAIVVPALETMRSSTVEALKAFEKAGGKLIFIEKKPTLMDAISSDEVKSTFVNSTVIGYNKAAVLSALSSVRTVEITRSNGHIADRYLTQLRTDGGVKWLFVCNGRWYTQADTVGADKITISVVGEYEPILYDTITGDIKPLEYEIKNGVTYIPFSLYLHDSVLIKLTKTRKKGLALPKITRNTIAQIDFKTPVPVSLDEPNVVLLDMGEYTYDDREPFMPKEEILRLDKSVRLSIGLPPRSGQQPWSQPEVIPEHTISVRYAFTSETTVNDAKVALEDAEASQVLFDGMPVDMTINGWFTDKFIKTVSLPNITPGKHTITITKPISERTFTEASFLLGSFSARVDGTEITIAAPKDKIGFGSIVDKGLPFYGANLTYKCEFDAPEECVAVIHANDYRGALISVSVDGKPAGKIVYAPYSVEVPVSKGKHIAELTLFGNRHNCFGALHNANPSWNWFGPNAWWTSGDGWSYEYRFRPIGIMRSPVIKLEK